MPSKQITARGVAAAQQRHDPLRDPLTGLPNRAHFHRRLDRALARRQATVAVLFIDLDNFRTLNDSLGHTVGDSFLRESANRISSCIRARDMLARIGGDEFAVLLSGAGSGDRAPRIAQRIIQAIGAPLELDGRTLTPSASIGVAGGRSTDAPQDVLRNSRLALCAAKSSGKGQARRYEASMHEAALERLELEADLHRGLERNEFVLHYQPLFRLTDGELAGYEALVRWQHPTRGLLAPETFIELAEETGLIAPLTRRVLHAACEQIASWQRVSRHSLEIAVNLSFVNLKDLTIIADVAAAIRDAHISPGDLVLEMTESAVMCDQDTTRRILAAIKELGVRITIDDFGTGYSSLSRLSELPFDCLKIPRPFIAQMVHSDTNLALAQGIVDLAHRLGLAVVAEGIETPTELAYVRAIGCELGQGYHLGIPASGALIDPHGDHSRRTTALNPAPVHLPSKPRHLELVYTSEPAHGRARDKRLPANLPALSGGCPRPSRLGARSARRSG